VYKHQSNISVKSPHVGLVAGEAAEEEEDAGPTLANITASGNAGSEPCGLSTDGRYVCVLSSASNLVPGDTNGVADAFIFDTQSETFTRVSVASDGSQANGLTQGAVISTDGQSVIFHSYATNLVPGDTNGRSDVFKHEMASGVTTRMSFGHDSTQAN